MRRSRGPHQQTFGIMRTEARETAGEAFTAPANRPSNIVVILDFNNRESHLECRPECRLRCKANGLHVCPSVERYNTPSKCRRERELSIRRVSGRHSRLCPGSSSFDLASLHRWEHDRLLNDKAGYFSCSYALARVTIFALMCSRGRMSDALLPENNAVAC